MPRTSASEQNQDPVFIRNPRIRRCCRRAGVKRISKDVYGAVRDRTEAFLEKILHDAVLVTQHCKRAKVNVEDIKYAAKLNGKTIYGY